MNYAVGYLEERRRKEGKGKKTERHKE